MTEAVFMGIFSANVFSLNAAFDRKFNPVNKSKEQVPKLTVFYAVGLPALAWEVTGHV